MGFHKSEGKAKKTKKAKHLGVSSSKETSGPAF